jgi:positive phototaxis protein PixI
MRLALEGNQAHPQVSSVSIAGLESWVNSAATPKTMQRFLRVQMCPDRSCLVAVEEIVAVRTVAIAEIVPVPQMNACVLGFCRGEDQPLWLIDLAQ